MTTLEVTLNWEIYPLMKALAMVSVVMSVRGLISGQHVNQSIQVRRYVKPLDGGSGPTTSLWMMLNRASGVGSDEGEAVVCL